MAQFIVGPEDGIGTARESRDSLLFKAQMCQSASRFEEMAQVMQTLCRHYDDLSEEERNLLSCAYKNIIGSRRTSFRILNETLDACQAAGDQPKQLSNDRKYTNPETVNCLLSIVKEEIRTHCMDIIKILNELLIPSPAASGESKVFYYKMKGDYMRYLCETCKGLERKEKANESLLAYKTASEKATIELPPTHPVRLGLMLNFSVFYYEIMDSRDRSCRLAKQAFDDAIAELDTLSEESYRDSTIIMQLLRDNLNLWESERPLQPQNEFVL